LKTSLSGLMPCWRNAAVEYMRYWQSIHLRFA
jgi:hypothetical protein